MAQELNAAEAAEEKRRLFELGMKNDLEKDGFILLHIGYKSYKFTGTWEENQEEIRRLINESLEEAQKQMYKDLQFKRFSIRFWFVVSLIFLMGASISLGMAKSIADFLFALFSFILWGFVLYTVYRDIQNEKNL